MIVYPTGTCFDDAIELLEHWMQTGNQDMRHARLVHGILTLPGSDGKHYSHAWVELFDITCWDAGIVEGQKVYYKVPLSRYYELRGMVKCTRYTMDEWLLLNFELETYGPWEQQYLDLCIKREHAQTDRLRATDM